MKNRFQALVFDCDGTLVDSMPTHFIAWRATMLKYGIHFDEDRFYALGGVPTVKIIRILADEAGMSLDIEAVAHEKELAFKEAQTTLRPVEPVVKIARENRGLLPMAVATGSTRQIAEHALKQLEIFDWFDALVSADDVTHHKPHPEVFLTAAHRLKADPKQCCAYEDTDIGLEAARAAGMTVVDVRTMYTPGRMTK